MNSSLSKTSRRVASAAVGAALLTSCVSIRSESPEQQVRFGEMGYSSGPLVARGLLNYSVVVLDFRGSALLACVSKTQDRANGPEGLTEGNIATNLLTKAAEMRLNYRDAIASVNALSEESLRFITNDLARAGIRVTKADTRLAGQSRMVEYDPGTRKFDVEPDTDKSLF